MPDNLFGHIKFNCGIAKMMASAANDLEERYLRSDGRVKIKLPNNYESVTFDCRNLLPEKFIVKDFPSNGYTMTIKGYKIRGGNNYTNGVGQIFKLGETNVYLRVMGEEARGHMKVWLELISYVAVIDQLVRDMIDKI